MTGVDVVEIPRCDAADPAALLATMNLVRAQYRVHAPRASVTVLHAVGTARFYVRVEKRAVRGPARVHQIAARACDACSGTGRCWTGEWGVPSEACRRCGGVGYRRRFRSRELL